LIIKNLSEILEFKFVSKNDRFLIVTY